MIAVDGLSDVTGASEFANLEPLHLARMALGGRSTRKWVLSNLRYVARHHREKVELIELTGAFICLLASAKELRRIAETAAMSESDRDGEAVRFLLLSGFWRSDQVRHLLP